jgi:hypothetical protein
MPRRKAISRMSIAAARMKGHLYIFPPAEKLVEGALLREGGAMEIDLAELAGDDELIGGVAGEVIALGGGDEVPGGDGGHVRDS